MVNYKQPTTGAQVASWHTRTSGYETSRRYPSQSQIVADFDGQSAGQPVEPRSTTPVLSPVSQQHSIPSTLAAAAAATNTHPSIGRRHPAMHACVEYSV